GFARGSPVDRSWRLVVRDLRRLLLPRPTHRGVGGGDSAMEEALFLTRFADRVTIVVRRDELRASKIMADRAQQHEKIQFIYNSQVTAIHGDQKVTGLTLTDTITGHQRPLDATGVFIAIGHVPRTELVQDAL